MIPIVAGVALLLLVLSIVGSCCWRRMMARRKALKADNIQKHGVKSLGFSDGDDATVSNDSTNNDTSGDDAASGGGGSQKLPEDDKDERRMLGKVENDE
ncbi:hypothetical protein DFQ26_002035, partial [Actinomortierella ambigua]